MAQAISWLRQAAPGDHQIRVILKTICRVDHKAKRNPKRSLSLWRNGDEWNSEVFEEHLHQFHKKLRIWVPAFMEGEWSASVSQKRTIAVRQDICHSISKHPSPVPNLKVPEIHGKV